MTVLERSRKLGLAVAEKLLPEVKTAREQAAQVPELQRKFSEAMTAIQKQFTETVSFIREEAAGYSLQNLKRGLADHTRDELIHEAAEAQIMLGSGPSREPLSIKVREGQKVQLKERLWELELALEDRGWQRQIAIAATEFSRYGLQQIILISRLFFVKNPLVKVGVRTASNYVFGRGIEVQADDDTSQEILEDFIQRNMAEIGHRGLVEKEELLHTDGNVFFAFFRLPSDGSLTLRTIDATEIAEVVCDPDDASQPWYYRRSWSQQNFSPASEAYEPEPKQAWYPALDFDPPEKPNMIGGKPVIWDTPVCHMKIGGFPKWKFGVPDIYASIDWARAYQNFLSDWSTITRALARFAWNVETQGGAQAISAFNQALATSLGDGGGVNIERNPPPVTAAAFVSGPGNKLNPVRTAGATTEPEQGRRIMLMVAAAFGLPETFFGDASTGSLATAQSLDRPTELKFLERQEHWRETLQKICKYVLTSSAEAPSGKLRASLKEAHKEPKDLLVYMQPRKLSGASNLTIFEAAKVPAKKRDGVTISVKFPAVLEHNIKDMVTAIVEAATLGGYQSADTMDNRTLALMLLSELGAEDPMAIVDAMYPPGSFDPEVKEEPQPTQATLPPGVPATQQNQNPQREAKLLEATQQLIQVCKKLLRERAA